MKKGQTEVLPYCCLGQCLALGFLAVPLTNVHNSQSKCEQILDVTAWIVTGKEVPQVQTSASCGNGTMSLSCTALLIYL